MSNTYPGGLIRKTPPTITPPVDGEGGSAPGVWTLEQATNYIKQGTWPKPVLPRNLYTWGSGSYGATGQNNTTDISSPTQVGSLSNWESGAASTGPFSIVVKTDGTLWSWGYNALGSLGTGNVTYRSSPVQVGSLTNWSLVSAIGLHVLAIKTDGTLWSWGYNASGQLGIDSLAFKSSPTQVGSLSTWLKVSAGYNSSGAIKNDGTLWTWGNNANGELGQNNTTYQSSPVQVGALTNWKDISMYQGAIATKTDGTLWAWGFGFYGQLGGGNNINRSSPVQIGALTTWSSASMGVASYAIKTDGTLWSWGYNGDGQLGVGDRVSRSSPVQVGLLTTWSNLPPQGSTGGAMGVIKTDGTLWTWGLNGSGQMGDGTTINRSSPIQIGSLTTWYKVAIASNSNFAITKG